MPASMVHTPHEEKLWEQAKRQAEKEGHKGDWRYVVGIYERMKGHSATMSVRTDDLTNNARVPPERVHSYLRENYPEHVLKWVDGEEWRYLHDVPLKFIKMERRPGGRNMDKVKGIAKAVAEGKPMEPVVLVQTDDGFKIADGYHRTLAFRHAGKETIPAFVAVGSHDNGPWDRAMHDAKMNLSAAANIGVFGVQSLEGTPQKEVIETLSVDQRLERAERMLAVLVAERMSAKPNADGHVPKSYPKDRGEYADPEDKAYPLDTEKHVRNAASRFAQFKERYSKYKQDQIKRRIDEAEKRLKIGKYREENAAMSATDFQRTALEEVMSVMKTALLEDYASESEASELASMIRDLLASEENPRTRESMFDADAMIDDFMRDIKGYAGHGHP